MFLLNVDSIWTRVCVWLAKEVNAKRRKRIKRKMWKLHGCFCSTYFYIQFPFISFLNFVLFASCHCKSTIFKLKNWIFSSLSKQSFSHIRAVTVMRMKWKWLGGGWFFYYILLLPTSHIFLANTTHFSILYGFSSENNKRRWRNTFEQKWDAYQGKS